MPLPNPSVADAASQRNFQDLDKRLRDLTNRSTLSGQRDDPESALANLITLLEAKGILTDSTTAT